MASEPTLRIDGELPPLGMATDVVLLRAAQEAFTNIRKHSQANTVMVALSPGRVLASDSPLRTMALVLR